jgi:hypothetical protein
LTRHASTEEPTDPVARFHLGMAHVWSGSTGLETPHRAASRNRSASW